MTDYPPTVEGLAAELRHGHPCISTEALLDLCERVMALEAQVAKLDRWQSTLLWARRIEHDA
jgi:hypothetical protein